MIGHECSITIARMVGEHCYREGESMVQLGATAAGGGARRRVAAAVGTATDSRRRVRVSKRRRRPATGRSPAGALRVRDRSV